MFANELLIDNGLISTVTDCLHKAHGGELFIEEFELEHILMEFSETETKMNNLGYTNRSGFGLRSFMDDKVCYYHSQDKSKSAIANASNMIKTSLNHGANNTQSVTGSDNITGESTIRKLYPFVNPISEYSCNQKIDKLKNLFQIAYEIDPRTFKVLCSFTSSFQKVDIIRKDGRHVTDERPLVKISFQVYLMNKEGRMEVGRTTFGGRDHFSSFLSNDNYQEVISYRLKKAIKEASICMEAEPGPAGEMEVVLANGWTGVLLHEAVGHGLEGDGNRKGNSAFSGRIGEQVANKGITVVDDGTIEKRRGSINVDDEGNVSGKNILIKDGILQGYMQDEMNARLMGHKVTGNGRREDYRYVPLPRMTNTYMENGNHTREEMLESVKRGIYSEDFGGGQVDITSGDFVFNSSVAYYVEDGKIVKPIKGATIIGNGPDVLNKISMIGNDLELDEGTGVCGKYSQWVPVGLGIPSVKVDQLVVGGSAC